MGYRDYSTAKGHIVDALGHGDFTTISAAITAASSGQTIFIRPGTYTENPTLKAGVNLEAFGPDITYAADSTTTPDVIINGTCTFTGVGTVGIDSLCLQTNSAAALVVSGSSASVVVLNKCFLNCSNTTGITFSSSSGSSAIQLNFCGGDLGTTGIALFSHSSAGNLRFLHSSFSNSGTSLTANTVSGTGGFFPNFSSWSNGISLSSSSNMQGSYLDMTMSGNQIGITTAGTSTVNVQHCNFTSGTSSCISIGAGTSVTLHYAFLSSSNGSTVTGTGTFSFTNLTFNSVASLAAGLTLAESTMNSFISGAGVGTSGQVLTSNGVSNPPTYQTGGWTLIQTLTASNSASLSFTNLGNYTNIVFVFRNVNPVTNGTFLQFQYSTNGGSSYVATGYISGVNASSQATYALNNNTNTTSAYVTEASEFGTSTPNGSGDVWIYNIPFTTSLASLYKSEIVGNQAGTVVRHFGQGSLGNAAAINAIQFSMASGNINSGSISLYGVSS